MFKLWFILEYRKNRKSYKGNINGFLKLLFIYVLPNLIAVLLGYIQLLNLSLLTSKSTILLLVSSNITIITITHYMIHKYFFNKLENDEIISFLPSRMGDYIKVRVLTLLIKWNLPFIIFSIFCFKRVVEISKAQFYLSIIIFLACWFILNYLIAIYSRYIISIFRGKAERLLKGLLFSVYFLLLLIMPEYIIIEILKELELAFNQNTKNHIQYININFLHIIFLALILILSLILLKYTDKYFKINIRKIIINKHNVKVLKKHQISNKNFNKLTKVLLISLTDLEQRMLIKDIKSFFRENRITIILIFSFQVIINLFMLYIFHSIIPNNISSSIELFISIYTVLLIFIINTYFFLGKLGLKDIFKINKDLELLNKYNINVNKNNLINVKRGFATICLFYPIFIFYIIAFVTTVNKWAWFSILFSLIPTLIIEKILSLYLVKSINQENSSNIIVVIINLLMVGACCITFMQLYNFAYNSLSVNSIKLWIGFNVLLIVNYLFNLNINKVKPFGYDC